MLCNAEQCSTLMVGTCTRSDANDTVASPVMHAVGNHHRWGAARGRAFDVAAVNDGGLDAPSRPGLPSGRVISGPHWKQFNHSALLVLPQ